jgi:hypothetical protein
MEKYFYEANCRIFIKAKNEDEAEKLIKDISLVAYLVDEDIYQVDEDYVPVDLDKRMEKLGTHFHPMEDSAEYEQFKKQVRRYGGIFRKFLNGKFDQDELLKRMDQADKKEVDAGDLIYQVQMVDLDTKQGKTAKLVPVD